MPVPQFLSDLLQLLFDLAVPAAFCTLAAAGVSLRPLAMADCTWLSMPERAVSCWRCCAGMSLARAGLLIMPRIGLNMADV